MQLTESMRGAGQSAPETAVLYVDTRAPPAATMLLCSGLLVSELLVPSFDATAAFQAAAVGVGLSLLASLMVEATRGLRSLVRVDLLMLVSLYGLTFLEFLFPQQELPAILSPEAAKLSTQAVMLGMAGIAIGRHLVPRSRPLRPAVAEISLSPRALLQLFLGAFLLGFLHVFLAVNFDVVEAVRQMGLPRFSQSWTRGRLGDASALLVELGLLIYLVPPLGGAIVAEWWRYGRLARIVVGVCLLFTLYFGFSSGTRNIFVSYVVTFCGAYFALRRRIAIREALIWGGTALAAIAYGLLFMVDMRNVGLGSFTLEHSRVRTLAVDYNLISIAQIVQAFPDSYGYLGWEIPYQTLIRPVPRVLWPEKPEGLSVSIEQAIGADGWTVAVTFVGEAYMSAGLAGVVLIGLVYGILAGFWNKIGQRLDTNFRLILYVSGFLGAVIGMRSMLALVPTLLPTLALWIYGQVYASAIRR